ncbi:MAG: hypothetical protein AAF004_02770 [Pseudomonadota bacterium]
MERIVNILTATTIVTIFAYLLFFYGMSIGGNGGDYWGFSPSIEPHRAAANSFEQQDYLLLSLEITNSLGELEIRKPAMLFCSSDSGEIRTTTRTNIVDAGHGVDSTHKAASFMQEFNSRMIHMMKEQGGNKCEYYAMSAR